MAMDTGEIINSKTGACHPEIQDDLTTRRQLRQKYRDVIRDTRKESKNLAVPSDDRLFEKVQCSSELFQNVRQAREGVLDSQLLRLVSDIGKAKADAFQAESVSFDDIIFISKLQGLLSFTPGSGAKQTSNSWNKIVGVCQPLLVSCPPSMTTMRGSMEVSAPKIRAKTERTQTRDKSQVVSKPKVVTKSDISRCDDTKTAVEWLYKCLHLACEEEGGEVLIWDFVIDPKSYTATVENLFHLTFLIKDGRSDLFEQDNSIYLRARKSSSEQELAQRHHRQFVFSLDFERWEQLKEEYSIQEAMVPKNEHGTSRN